MFNAINGNTRTTLGPLPDVSAAQFAEEMRAAQAQAAAPPVPAPQPSGSNVLQGIVDAVVQNHALLPPPSSNGSPLAQDEFMLAIDELGNWPLAHYQAQQLAQKIAIESAPPVSFTGSSAQVAQEITQQFIWGEQQAPVPNAGLQQVLTALPAVLADTANSEDQQMIGLAESQLANCHNMVPTYNQQHPHSLIIIDDMNAQMALEIAEQPDGQKHGLVQRVTLPNGGGTLALMVSPNGSISSKKEHGTFFSQVMGVVDNIITPIVDIAAIIPSPLQAIAIPAAIGLNVVEGSQQLAEGNILGGMLDIAAAAAGGVGEYFNAEATALNATDSIAAAADRGTALIAGNVLKGVSAAQGLKGTIQAGIQGDGLAAFASAVGGIGGSGALGGGIGIDNLSRDALVASGLAGAAIAAQGNNPLDALAALTSAAASIGLFEDSQSVVKAVAQAGTQSGTAPSSGGGPSGGGYGPALDLSSGAGPGQLSGTVTASAGGDAGLSLPGASSITAIPLIAVRYSGTIQSLLNPAIGNAISAAIDHSLTALMNQNLANQAMVDDAGAVAKAAFNRLSGIIEEAGPELVANPVGLVAVPLAAGAFALAQAVQSSTPGFSDTVAYRFNDGAGQGVLAINAAPNAPPVAVAFSRRADNTLITSTGQVIGAVSNGQLVLNTGALRLAATDAGVPIHTGSPIDPRAQQPIILSTPSLGPQMPLHTGNPLPAIPGQAAPEQLPIMDKLPPLPGLTIQDQPVPTILERNPLRDAMKAATAAGTAGIHSITPAEQAHHIVLGGKPIDAGRDATEAQDILEEFGIGLDTILNGVGLTPGLHSRIHTKDYYALYQ